MRCRVKCCQHHYTRRHRAMLSVSCRAWPEPRVPLKWQEGFAMFHSSDEMVISQSRDKIDGSFSFLRLISIHSVFLSPPSTPPPLQPPQRWSSPSTWGTGRWRFGWRPTPLWTTTGGTACGPSATSRRPRYAWTSSPPPRRRLPLTDTSSCSSTASCSSVRAERVKKISRFLYGEVKGSSLYPTFRSFILYPWHQ